MKFLTVDTSEADEMRQRALILPAATFDPASLAAEIAAIPVDRESVPQDTLDLQRRHRVSLYPWRGQFSPGLVGLLLQTYANADSTVLDPFAGSGTTLFEAAQRQLACHGVEVNPAGHMFCSMAQFSTVPVDARQDMLRRADDAVSRYLGEMTVDALLPGGSRSGDAQGHRAEVILRMARQFSGDPWLSRLAATTVMLAMGDGTTLDSNGFLRAYRRNREIVLALPYTHRPCEAHLADARAIPLRNHTVDLVVTSPPYINVFNYHQNYRKAMELLGWRPLAVAQSEIGSNRKYRGNRFLTVIQYCIDMLLALQELRRVATHTARVVMVVGRESTVRGVRFRNGHLLGILAAAGSGFEIERWQERRFTNRFGEAIYEDILTMRPNGHFAPAEDIGRAVGCWALLAALDGAPAEVQSQLRYAATRAPEVRASPVFRGV